MNKGGNKSLLEIINDSEKKMTTRTTRSTTKVQNITPKRCGTSHIEDNAQSTMSVINKKKNTAQSRPILVKLFILINLSSSVQFMINELFSIRY